MRAPICLLFALAVLAAACGARSVPPGATIRFDTERAILRKPFGAGTMLARFPFVNGTGAAVRVVAVERGCGCMSVDPSAWEEVPPGSSSALLVSVDCARFTAAGEKTLVAVIGDARGGRARCPLCVRVEPLVTVDVDPLGMAWGRPLQPRRRRVSLTVSPPEAVASVRWTMSAPERFAVDERGGGNGRWEAEVALRAEAIAALVAAGQPVTTELVAHLRAADGAEETRTVRLDVVP